MCRLALLNGQAALLLGPSYLEYLCTFLEHAMGGDGNGVAGWWEQSQRVKIYKGTQFSAAQAAATLHRYAASGASWLLFHTRRATSSAIIDRHCHPFQAGRLVLAHNGHDQHFAILGQALALTDSECITRTWSQIRFPLTSLTTRAGVFIGFTKNYPFVIKGQESSDLFAAWNEPQGAVLFASMLPPLLRESCFDHVTALATIEWFGRELDHRTLNSSRRTVGTPLYNTFGRWDHLEWMRAQVEDWEEDVRAREDLEGQYELEQEDLEEQEAPDLEGEDQTAWQLQRQVE